MTIVASNSLTISNVYDGTITHAAYSWSADGTDRLSTVYPNLNLLEGSKKYTKNNPFIASSSATDGAIQVQDVFVNNLKAGTYTMSAKSDAPWTNHDASDKKGKVGLWLISTTTWEYINLGNTVPKTIKVTKDGRYFVRVNTYSNGTDIETHKFWDFKLELGSIATPHMPSASEVTTNDYPSYRGEYSDFSDTASTDPSKYSWGLIRGNASYTHTAYSWSADGKDGFTTVYPNLNLLTDSKDFKNKNLAESKATTSITSPDSTILKEGNDTYLKFIKSNQSQDWFRAYVNRRTQSPNFPNVDIKGNTNYTFSVWLKGTGTHTLIAYDSWTNPINAGQNVTLTSDWKLYTLTVLSRPTADIPADKNGSIFYPFWYCR
ncbi:tail-host specificity protein [Lactococcus phage phiL47]|uniref:Tail-host specificity protein n=1 Tax=Lactococcus phage phiL47 TaxID=1412875 RepID=V9VI43_9CAUD|nr:tail protein [Lactococcus phage phiL47]AHC94237.1 tail-host specificity protein [Lactococcus phage phiL47]